ncbi:hypothetical protein [Salinicoccus roseus]|uniref:hypothetical protein n=1 Tax=Salinicoccus roseus TaxID=45670 RepID=UPI0022FFEFFD|nr:hypothetical protein [Salinicoccus roseus]
MKNKKMNILGVISILIPTILSILILNFFLGIIPTEKFQGMPLIMPIILCPIGAIIGSIGYKYRKDRISKAGVIFNVILFLFPITYNILVTLIFGV